MKKARAVYERGVVAVRHSVDMWAKYYEFLTTTVRVPVDEARLYVASFCDVGRVVVVSGC